MKGFKACRRVRSRARWGVALLGVILLASLFTATRARALEIREGDIVVIGADEVIQDDLYVSAGEFTLQGTVQGDLIVVGGTLKINGTVQGDLIAAGQSIVVNGNLQDDARMTGFALTLAGTVADDVTAAGFSVESGPEAAIGGDFIYAGYQGLLQGIVGGDAKLSGVAIQLDGTVQGDMQVDVDGSGPGENMTQVYGFFPGMPEVPSVPVGLHVGEEASIGGDLTYSVDARTELPAGAVAGETDLDRPEDEDGREGRKPLPLLWTGRWTLNQFRRLIAFLLVGALMMWLVPGWTRGLAENVEQKPLPSLGWGVVSIGAFGVLMLALILATILLALIFGSVTGDLGGRLGALGGLLIAATGFSFGVLWRYVTLVALGLLLGRLIFRLFNSPAEDNRWWPMVLGVVLLAVVTAVPVIGWLIRLLVALFGLGALWIWGLTAFKQRRAASPGAA